MIEDPEPEMMQLTQDATEKPAGEISPMSGTRGLLDGKNECVATADDTAPVQRGRPFQAGQSGNPGGRPKGSRNRATLALESLLDGEAEALTRKAIELALGGDMTALRLCLDRILPPRKDRPVVFSIPVIQTAADAKMASAALLSAVAAGSLTPSEAAEVGKLVDAYLKAIEVTELLTRIEKLEQRS
jgi:hypothetical protein